MAKVLLVAPTCDRNDIGEAWVAYNWARGLADRHDVTLLTYRKRGRQLISDQLDRVRVIEWQEPPLIGHSERLNSMLKPGYLPFYHRAMKWIRLAIAHGEQFDIAHQPVPVAMRYPSPLAHFPIPYVIGPVGGGLESPPTFVSEDTAPWFVRLRSLDHFRLRRDPLLRRTYARAACVLGIAPYVADALSNVPLRRLEYVSETAIDDLPASIDRSHREGPVRLLFVGRLIRTKGARDAINSLKYLRDVPLTFDIVGDGFDRGECERLVSDLKLSDRVSFHGATPREQIDRFYSEADIFVFPSFREPGGNVTFEAMAFGLPLDRK